MENKYIAVKYSQSPFNMDDIGKDVLILCENGKPFSEIWTKWVKEGDEFTKDQFVAHWTNKSNKHLVIGDVVNFGEGKVFVGEIEKIDEYDWENGTEWWDIKIHLKNCKNQYLGTELDFHYNKYKTDDKVVLKRSECEHIQYLYSEMNFDENRLWKQIEKEYNDLLLTVDYDGPTTKEVLEFFKSKTIPR